MLLGCTLVPFGETVLISQPTTNVWLNEELTFIYEAFPDALIH